MYYTVYNYRVFASKLSWNMNLVKRWKLFKFANQMLFWNLHIVKVEY